MTTINERLTALRRLLDATENALNLPEAGESDEKRKTRHSVALLNIMQVTDEAHAIGRDLTLVLLTNPLLDTHSLVYFEPPSQI